MRTLFSILFVTGFVAYGLVVRCEGQSYSPQIVEDYDLPLVRRALSEQAQGASFSFTNKYVARLGDRVSIALLKIFDDSDLHNPRQLRAALKLVRESFAS